jgi:serine/threonine protein kinase/WD40 repeat protein
MNSPQHIYLHARGLPDSEQRSRYLDEACTANPALRQQVEHLLANDAAAAMFFDDQETQDDDHPREAPPSAVSSPLPEQIGPYRILERIGLGGMGEVYRAEQRQPIRREVALKVVKLGMDTRQVVARFEAERQALALMDHPHIAKVFGADADDMGRPYFAMEYVKGVPITEYADNNHLTVRERLELFQQVCHAIQHAHQKGVIHRDIKPSNILVSTQDGRPHAKVIDFGIAKATAQQLTDKTLFTLHDQFIGTPQYMSPEQATGSLDIDTRADVYSLGVLLYELLTGHTPFDTEKLRKAALGEIARIIREDEPPKPSTRLGTMANPASGTPQGASSLATLAKARSLDPQQLIKEIRGELDWMVMRAMDKDRARRYVSPLEMADDIDRYLTGSPIEAAPPDWRYQTGKFLRRHKLPVSVGAVIAVLVLVGTILVSTLAWRLSDQIKISVKALETAEEERANANTQRIEAEKQREVSEQATLKARYELAKNRSHQLLQEGLLDQALAQANDAYRLNGSWEDGLLIQRIIDHCRRDWNVVGTIRTKGRPMVTALVEHEGRTFLLVSTGTDIEKYDLANRSFLGSIPMKGTAKQISALGPGTAKACVWVDSELRVISVPEMTVDARRSFDESPISCVSTGDSSIALAFMNDEIELLDSELNQVASTRFPAGLKRVPGQALGKIAVSPDGRKIAVAGRTYHNECLLWEPHDERSRTYSFYGSSMIFKDNETLVSFAGSDGSIHKVSTYRITADTIKPADSYAVSPHTVGTGMLATWTSDGEGFVAGNLGIQSFALAGSTANASSPIATRYLSLLGLSIRDVGFSSASRDGSHLLLRVGELLIHCQRAEPRHERAYDVPPNTAFRGDDLLTALVYPTATAMRGLRWHGPIKDEKTVYLEDQRIHSRENLVWSGGMAISQNGKTIAIRSLEAAEYPVVTVSTANHMVTIYHELDPWSGTPSGTRMMSIMLQDQSRDSHMAARNIRRRLLALSPKGDRLLIGKRDPVASVAELYDTAGGRLLRQWTPDAPLGPEAQPVGNSECFADLAPDLCTIRIRSYSDGEIVRSIELAGPARRLCFSPDGSKAMLVLNDVTIALLDMATGGVFDTLETSLTPVAITNRGDVFAAFESQNKYGDRGAMVLADFHTGETLALLDLRTTGEYAQFDQSGTAIIYPIHDTESGYRRRMSPEDAEGFLLENLRDLLARDEDGTWNLIENAPLKDQQGTPKIRDLQARMGEVVTIAGEIVEVAPTMDGRSTNLFLDIGDGKVLLWINRDAMIEFEAGMRGDFSSEYLGRHLQATGRLEKYGGKKSEWVDYLQISLKGPSDIQIPESDHQPE